VISWTRSGSSLYGYFGTQDGDSNEASQVSSVSDVLVNSIVTTNRYIATTHPKSSMFASVFFGLLEPKSGEMKYINAGHEAPVIFRQDGSIEVLDLTGGVLGLYPVARYSVGTVKLGPGDLLFAYTDGVNEAKNTEGEQFTDQRIMEITDPRSRSAAEFVEHVLEQVKAFRGEADQSDDITMVAMKFLASR
jgi:sigma-B regulation protein RsbU (phosphoserine phosphatase)